MGFQVDTAEVRRVIKELNGIAQNVKELSSQNVHKMQTTVEESLKGDAADALAQVLAKLSGDIQHIGSGLDSVQKALTDYAERIDQADQEAKEAISSN